jgi:hypothetical protein
MDLERAARESGVVRPEHVDALLRSLKMRDFNWLVCNPSQTEERLQGDLMREMPIAVIRDDGNAHSRISIVMVINNVCDLQAGRSEFITLAPVHDFKKFAEWMLSKDREKAKTYLARPRLRPASGIRQFDTAGRGAAGSAASLMAGPKV